MNRRVLLWAVPILVWSVFTLWYTDFGGPLSDEEIERALSALEKRGMEAERFALFAKFLREDTGRQFLMVNNIDMSDNPPSMAGFGPAATAEDYNDHYMEHMYPQLLSRACHPIFFGTGLGVGIDITGIDGAHGWDLAALFRYKSRRAFIEVVTHPDMGSRHAFKHAAMDKTIAYPVEPGLYVSDLRIQLLLVLGLLTALLDGLFFRRSASTTLAGKTGS
ncbi:MAG: hypothetical protein NXH85_12025 [Pseudomonadaceae bacterium]|nr:hypothetical protein [Pseudomonadaceae bacterium]